MCLESGVSFAGLGPTHTDVAGLLSHAVSAKLPLGPRGAHHRERRKLGSASSSCEGDTGVSALLGCLHMKCHAHGPGRPGWVKPSRCLLLREAECPRLPANGGVDGYELQRLQGWVTCVARHQASFDRELHRTSHESCRHGRLLMPLSPCSACLALPVYTRCF